MKTLIYIALLALGTASLSACSDFLDKEPISQITPDEYFNSETNANSAVIGMYRTMMNSFSFGQSLIIVPEFSAGHVNHASVYPEYENFRTNTVQVNNPWTNNIWQATYATINAANNIIARVPEMPENSISTEKRQQFIGEAKFVRALNYFFLVRAFGAVPLKTTATTEEEDIAIPRTPIEQVYQQIITDLQEASTLPDSYDDDATSKGRATSFAAKALLAKVQLYYGQITGDYTQAASLSQEIINSQRFALIPDFASIWTTENTQESIFELQFDDQATNPLASVSNDNPSMLFYARGNTVYEKYAEGDKRRDFTVKLGSRDRYYIGKYPKFSPATQNLPVIRIAEIYLIHAEAQARVDGTVSDAAYRSYQAVQQRAGLSTPPSSSFGSIASFITAIQEEKERELMFEGETWFDFCRTGLALERMLTIKDPNYYLYPIPSSQIVLNGELTQNPGY
ncbi:RagB/SusD family nutrient uptake outer membrane protein [Olivibacter sp. XZL3]|uniref:RagB/SusD family nutrient uptake outer membrane protein n=1 Tax=Olivibacter sp. XZL3 TaxID=1735116 RepID=UPI001065CC16|nr:RagB/SusD family nutrient uptake outer membrane protein [Olivibacter sp. XZL3]